MKKLSVVLAICLSCVGVDLGCISGSAGADVQERNIERLLRVLENPRKTMEERRSAALQLGDIGDPACITRMAAMLPPAGQWDVVTSAIITSLGQIGGDRALSVLKKTRAQCESEVVPGKIVTFLEAAIARCEGRESHSPCAVSPTNTTTLHAP